MKFKKLSLTILTLTLLLNLQAQEELFNGSYVTGGFLSASISKNDESIPAILTGAGTVINANQTSNTQTISFFPYFGKELSPHWLLGAQLNTRFQKSKSNRDPIQGQLPSFKYKFNAITVGISIFSRYSFNPENRLVFFLQPHIGYLHDYHKTKQNTDTLSETSSNSTIVGSNIGCFYNINNKWRAMLRFGGISYERGKIDHINPNEYSSKFDDFDLNMSLSGITLGFELKF